MLEQNKIEALISEAQKNTRKRSHLLLHESHEALLHRLVIALHKGTYVKPHNHAASDKEEVLFVLQGSVCVVYFDEAGCVIDKQIKTAGHLNAYGEHTSNAWHTQYPLTENAVVVEIKRGPFVPISESEFASWAPNEGDDKVPTFLNWLAQCSVGDSYLSVDD